MNAPILFLMGALALSMLGGLVVWLASRPRRERFGSTIGTFSRDLDALAPAGLRSRRRRVARAAPTNGLNGSTNNLPKGRVNPNSGGSRAGKSVRPTMTSESQSRPRPGPRVQRPAPEKR